MISLASQQEIVNGAMADSQSLLSHAPLSIFTSRHINQFSAQVQMKARAFSHSGHAYFR
jgi:hypothetical protein